MSADGAADRFWLELRALYQAAGKPTLKRLVSLGMEQRPPVPVSDSTINGWLNGKAVPTGRKNEHYLAVLVSFLQARTREDKQYEPLPEGEWGRLLHRAKAERAAGKKNGRPRRAAGEIGTGLAQESRIGRTGDLAGLADGQLPDDGCRNRSMLWAYRAGQARGVSASARVGDAIAWHDSGLWGTPPGVLVGRDSELAMLAGLVQAVAAGGGGAVLIEGEPGIGKSALVRAALAGAIGLGCQVFWSAGDELDQALPLQPLLDGLRVRELSGHPRRHAMARLLRGEAVADRGADVSAVLGEQLLALVAECCAARPTVLVFDDLQWADQASIALWGRLARSVRQMPLLLVGMMRPVPRREGLLAL